MTDVLKMGKKVLTIGVVATTILWSLGVAAFVAPLIAQAETTVTLTAGDVIRGASTKNVFYYAADGKRYTFPTDKVFYSWYKDWSMVKVVSDAQLGGITIGGTVAYRPGTNLVKIQTDPKVYAVEANGTLRWVETEAIAKALWGNDWAKRVHDVDPSIFPYVYKISASSLNTATYPVGSLVKMGADYYLVGAGMTKQKVTAEGLTANMLQTTFAAVATDLSAYASGADLATKNAELVTVVGAAVTTPTTPVTGGALTVTLSASTPAATTLADGTSYNKMLTVNLTAGDKAVKVNGITVTKTGFVANADVTGVSVWDSQGNRHGDVMTSISSDNKVVIGFANNPIVVAAGTTETLSVAFNLDSDISSGTIGAKIVAATDVVTDGTVSGTFPIMGNESSVVDGSNSLAAVTMTTSSPGGLSSEPTASTAGNLEIGETKEIAKFKFTETSGKADISVSKLTFYLEGTIKEKDLKNFTVVAPDNTVLGTTEWSSNRYVTVNFANGYTVPKSNNRTLTVKATANDGSGNWFRVHLQNEYDLLVKDATNGYYLKPWESWFTTGGANTWLSAAASDGYFKMKSGSLTITKSASSPSGNVSAGSSDIVLAKFEVKAVGEDMEIRKMGIKIATTVAAGYDLPGNVSLRVGSDILLTFSGDYSAALYGTGSQRNLSQYLTIKSGETKILEVVGNIDTNSTTDTYQVSIGNFYAKRLSTLDFADNLPSSSYDKTANQLTVQSTNLTINKDTSLGNRNVAPGADHVIGQYVVRAGNAEAARLTNITLKFSGDGSAPEDYQNLSLWVGSTQLGSTLSTVATSSNSFSFNLDVDKNTSKVVTVKAYVNSVATGSIITQVDSFNYVGLSTNNTTTNDSSDPTGQTMNPLAANVVLAAVNDSSTISAIRLPNSVTPQQLGKWRFEAQNEAVTLDKITFQVKDGTYANDTTAGNFGKLYLYDSANMNSPLAEADYVGGTNNGYVEFTKAGMLTVSADSVKYLVLKGVVNGSGTMDAASINVFVVKSDASSYMEVRSSSGALLGTSAIDATAGDNTTNANFATSTYYLFHNAAPTIANNSFGTSLQLSSQAKLFRFTITNNGDREMRLSTTSIKISASGMTADGSTTGTISNWQLFEANSSGEPGTLLATSNTSDGAAVLSGGAFNDGTKYVNSAAGNAITVGFGPANDSNSLLDNFTVAAGSYRTLILTGDTTGIFNAKTQGSVSVSAQLDGATGFDATADTYEANWADGVIEYYYTPVGASENSTAYTAADSYDVVGDTLSRSL